MARRTRAGRNTGIELDRSEGAPKHRCEKLSSEVGLLPGQSIDEGDLTEGSRKKRQLTEPRTERRGGKQRFTGQDQRGSLQGLLNFAIRPSLFITKAILLSAC